MEIMFGQLSQFSNRQYFQCSTTAVTPKMTRTEQDAFGKVTLTADTNSVKDEQ